MSDGSGPGALRILFTRVVQRVQRVRGKLHGEQVAARFSHASLIPRIGLAPAARCSFPARMGVGGSSPKAVPPARTTSAITGAPSVPALNGLARGRFVMCTAMSGPRIEAFARPLGWVARQLR